MPLNVGDRLGHNMARLEPEALGDRELVQVFIASTLAEAQQAEELLTQRGVNYVVEVEAFGRTLFGSPRNVAVISVEAGHAQYCGSQLVAAGLGPGVLIDEPRT